MPPFTVLHVCMGNICRSPMAERLLALAVRRQAATVFAGAPMAVLDPAELVHSESAGSGGWHAGEEMNPPAARQVLARGGDDHGFRARKLRSDLIDAADLVLTATADQSEYVVALRPDANERTFVLGEFARLLRDVDPDQLPPAAHTPDAVYARGVALVAAAQALRGDAPPQDGDELDDPWGRGDQTFCRVADEIDQAVRLFAAMLL